MVGVTEERRENNEVSRAFDTVIESFSFVGSDASVVEGAGGTGTDGLTRTNDSRTVLLKFVPALVGAVGVTTGGF